MDRDFVTAEETKLLPILLLFLLPRENLNPF